MTSSGSVVQAGLPFSFLSFIWMSFNFSYTKLYENFYYAQLFEEFFMAVLSLKLNGTFTDNFKTLLLLDFTIYVVKTPHGALSL